MINVILLFLFYQVFHSSMSANQAAITSKRSSFLDQKVEIKGEEEELEPKNITETKEEQEPTKEHGELWTYEDEGQMETCENISHNVPEQQQIVAMKMEPEPEPVQMKQKPEPVEIKVEPSLYCCTDSSGTRTFRRGIRTCIEEMERSFQ